MADLLSAMRAAAQFVLNMNREPNPAEPPCELLSYDVECAASHLGGWRLFAFSAS